MATMSRPNQKLQVKRGSSPEESRSFKGHGRAEIHKLGGGTVMRGVFEPGWKWSNDVAPIAGTKSCQAPHLNYVISGRLRIRMDDGQEEEIGPGDFAKVEPGHDAWVVGDEPCVVIDFGGYESYAKPATEGAQKQRTAEDRPSIQ